MITGFRIAGTRCLINDWNDNNWSIIIICVGKAVKANLSADLSEFNPVVSSTQDLDQ